MTTLAELLESHEMAVAEALAANDHTGLTIPGIVASSGVPATSVARIIKRLRQKDLVLVVGKRLKAPIYRFNPSDAHAIELARIAREFSLRVMDRQESMSGTCEIREPLPVQTGTVHMAEFQDSKSKNFMDKVMHDLIRKSFKPMPVKQRVHWIREPL